MTKVEATADDEDLARTLIVQALRKCRDQIRDRRWPPGPPRRALPDGCRRDRRAEEEGRRRGDRRRRCRRHQLIVRSGPTSQLAGLGGDQEAVVKKIFEEEYVDSNTAQQEQRPYLINLKSKVKAIAERK